MYARIHTQSSVKVFDTVSQKEKETELKNFSGSNFFSVGKNARPVELHRAL